MSRKRRRTWLIKTVLGTHVSPFKCRNSNTIFLACVQNNDIETLDVMPCSISDH